MLGATSSSFVVEVPLLTVEVLDLSSPVLPFFSISVLGPYQPPLINFWKTEILVSSAENSREQRMIVVRVSSRTPAGRRGGELTRPFESAKHEMSTSHQTSPKWRFTFRNPIYVTHPIITQPWIIKLKNIKRAITAFQKRDVINNAISNSSHGLLQAHKNADKINAIPLQLHVNFIAT